MVIKVVVENKDYGTNARVRIGNRICNRQIASFLLTGASAFDKSNVGYSNEGIFARRFTTLNIGTTSKRFDWGESNLEMSFTPVFKKSGDPRDTMKKRLEKVQKEMNLSIRTDIEFVFTSDFDEYIRRDPESLEVPTMIITPDEKGQEHDNDRWNNIDI